ncbi:MAG: bifunctional diaminohydroxyphosphoribosylaminopyrimidine deaminase/5-amino-6-(5-phosphoribosylamino)uracil reductase RibD [Pirellulales bacterium]|nr:bifunctional diaminohydroxyphosphoribosylaminopyrimidine deaminase/5-amino-6-(5-phosphoribosylamino)uracil reductase RibD [Pirellulales bacterium]
MQQSALDAWHMARAIELARQGQGRVEPNPLVGCVVAHGAEIVGEGWHRRFGGPHAEIEALSLAGARAAGATLYVTLEPCCHQGKTPPCSRAVIAAGVRRVVMAMSDPFPQVAGGGLQELIAAGIEVVVGTGEEAARALNAPYLKRVETGLPWVIAKWAMSLDGKLATRTGDSRWISNESSRRLVHELRGRVDAIIVGRGTATADDPLLTARPAGPRIATRVVLDSRAQLASGSQLVRTARELPVLVAAAHDAPAADIERLTAQGCEVFRCPGESPAERLHALLGELGRREMTNVLVEGGTQVLGTLVDERLLDEVQVYIAPKIIGGADAPDAIGGLGIAAISQSLALVDPVVCDIDGDVCVTARVVRS